MKILPRSMDLHMHTSVSHGTDPQEAIIGLVRNAGIELFSVTDHDAVKGCAAVINALASGDPAFITGAEFSCKDEEGQYHILGYGYDVNAKPILELVGEGHALRISKLQERLDFLKARFGFTFSAHDIEALYALDNPGKPHVGNLMVRYGYAATKESAIQDYLNQYYADTAYVRPEDAIRAILNAGGIPVLAHPACGRGDEIIVGEDMDRRLRRLIRFGLQGVEAFYSGFTPKMNVEILSFAEQFELYVTAGSDYHGNNKLVHLGDTGLPDVKKYPQGLRRFLDAAGDRIINL